MEDIGERIEIELVPNDEPGGRHLLPSHRQQRPTGEGPAEHGDDDGVDDTDDPAARERRRLIAVAVGVGLVALLLGWTLGRGGDDAPAAAPADPETTAPPTTRATVPADDTIAPVDEPVDEPAVVPRIQVELPRSATELIEEGADIEVERVAVDPRLVGSGLRLVGGRSNATQLVEADLEAGTATTFGLAGIPPEFTGTLVIGDDWVVIPTYNGGGSFVVRSDGTVSRSSLQPDGNPPLGLPATERFWRISPIFDGGRIGIAEVDLAGDPTGVEIELPVNAWPAMADPAGGVIVQSSGRWFGIDPQGAEALGVGEMVAVDETMALLYDCPELNDCGLWRHDRATDETVRVPVEVGDGERYLPTAWWSADPSSGISPDGRHVVVWLDDGTGTGGMVIIDLEAGVVAEVETSGAYPQSALWSPDGAFVVYLASGGVPTAYELATGATFPVVTDSSLAGWIALGRRP